MPSHFRRSLPSAPLKRRPHDALDAPTVAAAAPTASAMLATMLLFDRDPGAMVAQVRAWLIEDDDA
jgi:hypothetical protein